MIVRIYGRVRLKEFTGDIYPPLHRCHHQWRSSSKSATFT